MTAIENVWMCVYARLSQINLYYELRGKKLNVQT